MNVLGVAAVGIAVNTWGKAIFSLEEFPDWAQAALDSAVTPEMTGAANMTNDGMVGLWFDESWDFEVILLYAHVNRYFTKIFVLLHTYVKETSLGGVEPKYDAGNDRPIMVVIW